MYISFPQVSYALVKEFPFRASPVKENRMLLDVLHFGYFSLTPVEAGGDFSLAFSENLVRFLEVKFKKVGRLPQAWALLEFLT